MTASAKGRKTPSVATPAAGGPSAGQADAVSQGLRLRHHRQQPHARDLQDGWHPRHWHQGARLAQRAQRRCATVRDPPCPLRTSAPWHASCCMRGPGAARTPARARLRCGCRSGAAARASFTLQPRLCPGMGKNRRVYHRRARRVPDSPPGVVLTLNAPHQACTCPPRPPQSSACSKRWTRCGQRTRSRRRQRPRDRSWSPCPLAATATSDSDRPALSRPSRACPPVLLPARLQPEGLALRTI